MRENANMRRAPGSELPTKAGDLRVRPDLRKLRFFYDEPSLLLYASLHWHIASREKLAREEVKVKRGGVTTLV